MLLRLLGGRAHCLTCRTPSFSPLLQRSVNIWTKQRSTVSGRSTRLLLTSKNIVCIRKETWRWLNSDKKRPAKSLRSTTWNDLREIFALAAPYKGRLALGLSMLGISSTIYLLVPRILGKLIDEFDEGKAVKVDPEKKEDAATRMARYFKDNPAAMLGVLFIGACAISARIYFMHTAGQLIINNLRTKVFSAVMKQDMAFFDKNKVGEMVSRLSTDALIVGYAVSSNLSEGVRALVTFIGSGALMVFTSMAMTKVVLFVIPIILGTFYVFGRLQRKYTMMMQEAVAGANQVLLFGFVALCSTNWFSIATERFSNVRTVRMLVAEKKEEASYAERMLEIWRVSKMEGLARGAMFGGFQFTGYFAMTVTLYYGSSLIGQGLLTYGELSSFCLYAVFCASSLGNISGFYTELMKGLGASARLFELKNRVPAIPLTGGIKAEHLLGDIHFESVAFAYPNRGDTPIFTDLNLKIPAGKITAVVGPSGSGKSTLAQLILRLYDPDQGRITVDGIDLKEYDPSWWRRQVGTVSQEPVLFSTSIWNNIAYAADRPDQIEEWQVQQAAAQSNSLEFIREFPEGFKTLVGEYGSSMLSGGQKQRIAIARALVMNPRILVMDEATSALDATSEYLVRQALSKLLANSHQTVLIIAHRLSTIKHADQIAVLDKGTIVELGTFEDLIKIEDGVFKKLVEKQTFGWRDAF